MCVSLIIEKFNFLNIYYQNSRGLRTKTKEFYENVVCKSYDIIVITESWLKNNIFDRELFDDRYIVYRRDRDSKTSKKADGGGVLIAVLNKYNCKRLKQFESDCEDLWISVDIPFSTSVKRIIICVVYLPPPVTSSLLDTFLANCNRNFDCELIENYKIILGDFNLGQITWSDEKDSYESSSAMSTSEEIITDFLVMNEMKQLNRIVNASGNILDLVLTNIPDSKVFPTSDSLSKIDPPHPPLMVQVANVTRKKLPFNFVTPRYNFYKANYELIRKDLGTINWHSKFCSGKNANDYAETLHKEIWNVIKKYVPLKNQIKNKYPPWFSIELIQLLREKNNIRCCFNKYKNPRDKISFDLLRVRTKALATTCYRKYIEGLEESVTKNPKLFWSFVKGRKRDSSTFPDMISDGEYIAKTGEEVCELFATYFASVYNDAQPNPAELNTSSPELKNDCFAGVSFTHEQVLRKLEDLDENKSPGSDNIPPLFIKLCAEVLVDPLLFIFNKSIATGIFPSLWKTAKVVPIPKGGESNSVSDYRPISLLCIFGKIFESLMCPLLQSHCKQLFTQHQHGFLTARSTVTNLIVFEETLIEALDANSQADVIYTDFCKAFDRVVHSVLLGKLKSAGITGTMLDWFKSYLTHRYFYVVANGFVSNIYSITSGVPQGSHLGPILFNLFVNDITHCFKNSLPLLYADDLKVVRVIKTQRDAFLLQQDLNNLTHWCSANGMQLNPNKCSQITFTRKTKSIESQYFINGMGLKTAEVIRDLGVLFDKKLTFIPHIDNIVTRASRVLGFVIRNGKFFKKPKTKIILYNVLVRSKLEYASVVWRPHYAVHMIRIERIQKRFLWHLAYSVGLAKKKRSYRERLKHFGMFQISERYDFIDLKFIFNVLNNKIDCPMLIEKIKFKVPRCNPRKPIMPLCPPLRRTVLGFNSAIPRLCRIVNQHSGRIDLFNDTIQRIRRTFYETLIEAY